MSQLMHGDRAIVRAPWCPVDGWPVTIVSHRDRDTWPTFRGDYCPHGPSGGSGWVLVRYDGWRDDEWVTTRMVERVFTPQDEPDSTALL